MKVNGCSIGNQGGDTALDALLRSGHDIPHECKSGVCGTCRTAATGQADYIRPAIGYHGKNEVLLCCISAGSDIEIKIGGGDEH